MLKRFFYLIFFIFLLLIIFVFACRAVDLYSGSQQKSKYNFMFQVYYLNKNSDTVPQNFSGVWRSWGEDGTLLYLAEFKEGKPIGPVISYYENGKVRFQCNYVNGKLDGKITKYFRDGRKRFDGNYKQGLPIGIWDWWSFRQNEYIKLDSDNANGLKTINIIVYPDFILLPEPIPAPPMPDF